jgi:hypothetical protein
MQLRCSTYCVHVFGLLRPAVATRLAGIIRSVWKSRHVLCDVSGEFIERRHPSAVTLIDHWVAALIDDPAKLPGDGSGRLER